MIIKKILFVNKSSILLLLLKTLNIIDRSGGAFHAEGGKVCMAWKRASQEGRTRVGWEHQLHVRTPARRKSPHAGSAQIILSIATRAGAASSTTECW